MFVQLRCLLICNANLTRDPIFISPSFECICRYMQFMRYQFALFQLLNTHALSINLVNSTNANCDRKIRFCSISLFQHKHTKAHSKCWSHLVRARSPENWRYHGRASSGCAFNVCGALIKWMGCRSYSRGCVMRRPHLVRFVQNETRTLHTRIRGHSRTNIYFAAPEWCIAWMAFFFVLICCVRFCFFILRLARIH